MAGGVLIALLKFIEYKHFIHAYPTEIYGGLVALIFTVVLVVITLSGSLWVMFHLNHNMMPASMHEMRNAP